MEFDLRSIIPKLPKEEKENGGDPVDIYIYIAQGKKMQKNAKGFFVPLFLRGGGWGIPIYPFLMIVRMDYGMLNIKSVSEAVFKSSALHRSHHARRGRRR